MSTESKNASISFAVQRRWGLFSAAVAFLVIYGGLLALAPVGSSMAVFIWFCGVVAVPAAAVLAHRGIRSGEHVLVRRAGYLLLDGDPIEVARVELRATVSLLRRISGFRLSLWVLHGEFGARDLILGTYPSLPSAVWAAQELEDFVTAAKLPVNVSLKPPIHRLR